MHLFLSLSLTALMLFACWNLHNIHIHKDDISIHARFMIVIVIVTCALQLLLFHTANLPLIRFLMSLYSACLYFLLITMVIFIQQYTQVFDEVPAVRRAFSIFGCIDGLLLICNTFYPLYFDVEPLTVWGMRIYKTANLRPLFYIHTTVCMLLVCLVIYPLIKRTIFSFDRFTREKFSIIFLTTTLSLLAASITNLSHFGLDLSAYFYSLAANLICYLSYSYVPHLVRNQARNLIVTESSAAIYVFDHELVEIYRNKSGEWLESHADLHELFHKTLSEMVRSGRNDMSYQETPILADGSISIYNIVIRRLLAGKEIVGYSFEFHNVTEEVHTRREALYQMTHDQLTGIYSQAYFFQTVQKELREHPDTDYLLIISDIYGFKFYNELFGREMGDNVLKREAAILRSICSPGSVYGRIADDEFAILARKQNFKEELINQCIAQMRQEFGNSQYKIYMNAGIYPITDHNEPVSNMCDKAKLVIEQIKHDYSVVLGYYSPQLSKNTRRKRWILDKMDFALSDHQFVMFLQPQVDASTGKWLGAEALVRWIHPERGMISPGDFIPVLEEAAVITKVDAYIWDLAAQKLSDWKQLGREDLYISVNVSGHDFYHVDLYQTFVSLVEKYQIAPKNLKIEVTETVLSRSKELLNDTLSKLRAYGFIVEIDDFGSGYSSLNSLKDMETDVIKIDMGFLSKTDHVGRSKMILNDIVHMIRNLHMGIVVEGVETQEQLDFVTSIGCDIIQGYYYSKPIPVNEFEQKLS